MEEPEKILDFWDCAVCVVGPDDNDRPKLVPLVSCRHQVCENCLPRITNPTCPICRTPTAVIPGKDDWEFRRITLILRNIDFFMTVESPSILMRAIMVEQLTYLLSVTLSVTLSDTRLNSIDIQQQMQRVRNRLTSLRVPAMRISM